MVCVIHATACIAQPQGCVTVAVAANVVPAMERLKADYQSQSSATVVLVPGSTGLLARQAREGAPFDLIVSADDATLRGLAKDGVVNSASIAAYARGRLVLWQNPESHPRLNSISDVTSSGCAKLRIAIANPDTAPYGAAARQALEHNGVRLADLDGRLVYGQDVRQAMQFAETGNVDAAFVSLSLTITKQDKGLEVPGDQYDPIVQSLGVLTRSESSPEARRLREFLLSRPADKVFRDFGYLPPTATHGEKP